MNLEKKYSPKDFEDKIYKKWEDGGYFKATINKEKKSQNKVYSIVLPPPNITGQLHMGHALDHTLQDILIRFKRMQGYDTLWQPGTDHASIATEVKVVEKIKKEEGKSKEELGRDEFLKRAWDWKEEFGGKIVEQMKKLGDSCDWSRERFTMDEGCNKAVNEFFVRLYEQGYIYRGNRIINWCPDCKTSLSDAEVEHEETSGHFYHINYKIENSNEMVQIATTRPETMLGDTAIAVHPDDGRYKNIVGKNVILPILNRPIPVVSDDYVDMEFGTGVVKITPCHDPNDFEVGKRHNLAQILVLNEDGTMNENAGKYQGLDRYECRKQILKDLEDLGQLVKVEDHNHNVGHCYRCNTVVEPMTSKQWFVKMDDLAKPAIEVLKSHELNLVPDRFDKIYLNWLENIRDWCISRQLWWGHQIPAYYCEDCGHMHVSTEKITKCEKCASTNIKQDEDVLDTWFSSALWPFSTLGWPDKTQELEHFFPTNTLVTGYDIIFFWVIRMVFSSLFITEKSPFKDVFIHGLVRDSQGRKMSKSLGNGIDPLQVIDEYGADALRFTLATGNSPGNDMRYYEERVISSRNFANKIWNSARFILMNLEEEITLSDDEINKNLETSDKWILSRVNTIVKDMTENMDKYELGIAVSKVYDFSWNEFCDWYIEIVKPRLYNSNNKISKQVALHTLKSVLKDILKLLHPFMPFVTEQIWTNFADEKEPVLICASWPIYDESKSYTKEEEIINNLIDSITKMRNARANMNISLSKKASLHVVMQDDNKKYLFEQAKDYFIAVGSTTDVIFDKEENVPQDSIKVITEFANLYIPTDDLVDYEKELARLEKEKEKLLSEIDRVLKKLSNEGFMAKAPQKLVDEEREKQQKYEKMLEEVNISINKIKK